MRPYRAYRAWPYGRACLRILRLIVRIGFLSIALPFLGFFSPFPHGTCTLSVIEEYLGLEGGPPFSLRSDPNSNTLRFTYRIEPWDSLQGYHLLWPDLPTFSQLQFTAPFTNTNRIIIIKGLAGFSIIQSTTNRMKPGEKEVNTLLRL